MSALSREHQEMLRRHRPALGRFASNSKLEPDRLAFVVADSRSRLGQAIIGSGIVAGKQASVVLPTSVEDIPQLMATMNEPDISNGLVEHGAVPVLLIDHEDRIAVVFEQLGEPSPIQNRAFTFTESP